MIEIIKSENKKTLKLSFDENNMPVLEVEYWKDFDCSNVEISSPSGLCKVKYLK